MLSRTRRPLAVSLVMLVGLRRDEAVLAARVAALPDRANRRRLDGVRREIRELHAQIGGAW